MSAKPLDIVALGEALIEFNQRDPAQPLYHRGFGGDTSNAVIAASRQGARCGYISQVGDDSFGAELLALWQRESVDAGGVRVVEGAPTGIYFVSHGPRGHEFTYRRAASAASVMMPADLPRERIGQAQWLHVSGISMAVSASACETVLEAVSVAKTVGTRVSFDLNFRPRLWDAQRAREMSERLLRDADLFFPSVDEVELLTGLSRGDDAIAWAHACGARQIALKLGAKGCIVSDGARVQHIAPYTVEPVDATGAGDCFAGSCLARLARGESLAEAAAWANVAAALSTQAFGAIDGLPDARAVEQARRQHR
jgi:2-dehydro-3-deoxygluconokinase